MINDLVKFKSPYKGEEISKEEMANFISSQKDIWIPESSKVVRLVNGIYAVRLNVPMNSFVFFIGKLNGAIQFISKGNLMRGNDYEMAYSMLPECYSL